MEVGYTLDATKLSKESAAAIDDVVMASDDPYVMKCLPVIEKLAKKAKVETSWQSKFIDICHNKGLTWSQVLPPNDTQDSVWYPLLPEREKMILGFTLAVEPNTCWTEVSQMPGLEHSSTRSVLNTVLPGSKYWYDNRTLLGRDILMVHGFSPEAGPIHREGAGETQRQRNTKGRETSRHIYIYIHTTYIYTYNIYIYRERERSRQKDRQKDRQTEFLICLLSFVVCAFLFFVWVGAFVTNKALDPIALQKGKVSDSILGDLAGNMVVGHCYAAVLIAVLIHWPVEGDRKKKEKMKVWEADSTARLNAVDDFIAGLNLSETA